jgi:hypothetical protein
MEHPPIIVLIRLHNEAMGYFVKEMYGEALTIFTEVFSLIHWYLQSKHNPRLELEQNQPSIPIYFRRARKFESLQEKLIFPNPIETPENSHFSLDQFSFITLYNLTLCTYVAAMMSRSRPQLQKRLYGKWSIPYNGGMGWILDPCIHSLYSPILDKPTDCSETKRAVQYMLSKYRKGPHGP